MWGLLTLILATALSAAVIRGMLRLAPHVGLIDHPGEHKQHVHSTPFVGGFGVLAALLLAVGMLLWLLPAQSLAWASLAVCALVMWGVGLADDRWKLSARIRLVIQAGLALLMVYGGGIVLVNLGDPLLIGALSLGIIAVPFTVFGVVGCINALNMVDGIDGLSGTVAAGTLALVALVTLGAGDGSGHLLAMALLGGVAGFLWFNLRFGSQHRARVFMGDNGSMMLGLLIAWQLIDITQGEQPLVPPVVALWMFAVPLIDTLAVMARRVWLGKSPFSPDRHHLHHLLQRAGFRVEHTVTIIGGLHLGLGLFGLLGAWLGVPDALMFAGFVAVFALYLRFTARPWRFVPMLRRLHRKLHLTPALNCGVFFGNSSLEHVEQINALVAPELKDNTVFRTRLYEYRGDPEHAGRRYAVVQILVDEDVAPLAYQSLYMRLLQRVMRPDRNAFVRGYVTRDPANERRAEHRTPHADERRGERRVGRCELVEESFTYVQNGRIVDEQVHQRAHPEGHNDNAASAADLARELP
ncbi:MraY family glycosyltransferase [Thauera mechernichensis]